MLKTISTIRSPFYLFIWLL